MDQSDTGIFTRHWRWWVLAFWVVTAILLVYGQWNSIRWFSLTDTDDNLRIAQVRAWLDGQGWYDLRQYKLNPPAGADIHWSRIVDLPLAAIKLAFTPFTGGAMAEKIAVAAAPMLPMLLAMLAMAATVRRVIEPKAFALGVAILLCAQSARGMWVPLRIDHHGWQLALLACVMLGLVGRRSARGGLIAGLATAASLAIGLEMLLYLAMAGAMIGLRWVLDPAEARRLGAYGASLAGGCAVGFLLFASYANRAAVCDALSPVWLSMMVGAGGIGVLLAMLSPGPVWQRFAAAAAAALLLIGFYAIAWPHCLGRLEGSTPDLEAMWLSNVREAMPIYRHPWRTWVSSGTLPLIGAIGYAFMLWCHRRDRPALIVWALLAAPAILAAGLLFWQTRAGPAAQLLAVPGAAALAWAAITWFQARANLLVRVAGTVGAFALLSGIGPILAAQKYPDGGFGAATGAGNGIQKAREAIGNANARCPTLPAMRAVALQPPGLVLTHVDMGPRLIAVTPHRAIAGPYHRNGDDILAIMRAFRGSPEFARRVVEERQVDYILICPNLSETTLYRRDAPRGFYVQLSRGQVPAWLERVDLGADSPFRMWRVRR